VSEQASYVCRRVADLPVAHVPSERASCTQCGWQVWVDPMRYAAAALHAGKEPVVLCSVCAGVKVK
jgi:hypothetical protein